MNSDQLQRQYRDSRNSRSVEDGTEFEDFAGEVLSEKGLIQRIARSRKYQVQGDSLQGVEYKMDKTCTKTQRLSIEYEERVNRDRPWVKAGILRGDGVWLYVQGNERHFWAFSKRLLCSLYEWAKSGDLPLEFAEIETCKKFYIPFALADELCVLKYPDDFNRGKEGGASPMPLSV